jgi:predicted signal transduction protein with EAL and GGDEF domain
MLELEITESMVMKDPERAVRVMERCAAWACASSIDDFGTGHSSLGYLKRFPIDQLKVDRSFVRDLPHNGDDVAITRAVIAMAHSLQDERGGRGVEHQEQFDLLPRRGLRRVPGFYCARPMEEADLISFVSARQPPASAARMATMKSRVLAMLERHSFSPSRAWRTVPAASEQARPFRACASIRQFVPARAPEAPRTARARTW